MSIPPGQDVGQGQGTTETRQPLDLKKLASWMSTDIPLHNFLGDSPLYGLLKKSDTDTIQQAMELRQFGFGQSNPTYLLSFPHFDVKLVLRKKPNKVAHASAHALHREFRVLQALQRHNVLHPDDNVPTPIVYSYCKDDQVIGAEFYLMEYVQGRIFTDASMPGISKSDRRRAIEDVTRVLASIHKVNITTVGLENFGKQGGKFVQRQIGRLFDVSKKQSELSGDPAPEIERLAQQLTKYASHCPNRFGLLHGTRFLFVILGGVYGLTKSLFVF